MEKARSILQRLNAGAEVELGLIRLGLEPCRCACACDGKCLTVDGRPLDEF